MNRTDQLAEFLVRTEFEDIPVNVREHAKLCTLDWLGASLAGSVESPSKIVRSVIRELDGRKESTIIGAHSRTTCLNAALANGISGHTVELDDLNELAILHPAAAVVPAALAVAEHCGSEGSDMITAIVLGYEVEVRLGMALNPSHYDYWHPTGTCGTFGATVAAGKLLGLSKRQMIQALGIAGTQAAGLIISFGTMSKPLNPGRAAQSGILAALLALRGFTSTTQVLDSRIGYCYAASREPKLVKLTEQLGTRYAVSKTCFKWHASCGHTHGAIDALQTIVSKCDVKPDMVERILVETYPIAVNVVGNKPEPVISSDAKFSLHYCLAAALVFGKVGLEEFSKQRMRDRRVRAIAKRVVVRVSKEFPNAVLGSARVTVSESHGRSTSVKVDVPKGYPNNPLTVGELKEKFRELARIAISSSQAEEIVTKVEHLDKIPVSSLAALL